MSECSGHEAPINGAGHCLVCHPSEHPVDMMAHTHVCRAAGIVRAEQVRGLGVRTSGEVAMLRRRSEAAD